VRGESQPCLLHLFHESSEETLGRRLYDLGNQQWDIAALRTLLQEVSPRDGHVEDFRVEHEFPDIGRKVMLLNAHQIEGKAEQPGPILLAISDITELELRRQFTRDLPRFDLNEVSDPDGGLGGSGLSGHELHSVI
jgi:hypothetical protein